MCVCGAHSAVPDRHTVCYTVPDWATASRKFASFCPRAIVSGTWVQMLPGATPPPPGHWHWNVLSDGPAVQPRRVHDCEAFKSVLQGRPYNRPVIRPTAVPCPTLVHFLVGEKAQLLPCSPCGTMPYACPFRPDRKLRASTPANTRCVVDLSTALHGPGGEQRQPFPWGNPFDFPGPSAGLQSRYASTGGGATTSTTPSAPTNALRLRGNDTNRNTGRSGCQNAATRQRARREERVTVQGPVKKQQPDGMSYGGGGG